MRLFGQVAAGDDDAGVEEANGEKTRKTARKKEAKGTPRRSLAKEKRHWTPPTYSGVWGGFPAGLVNKLTDQLMLNLQCVQ